MSNINTNRLAGVFIGAGIGVSLVNLFLSGRTAVKKPALRGCFNLREYGLFDREGSLRKYVAVDGEATPVDESCDDVSGVLYVSKCMPETRVYNNPVSLWNDQSGAQLLLTLKVTGNLLQSKILTPINTESKGYLTIYAL